MSFASSGFLPRSTPLWKRIFDFPLVSMLVELMVVATPLVTLMALSMQKDVLHDNGTLVMLVGVGVAAVSCLWYGIYFRLFHRELGPQLSWNVQTLVPAFALGVLLFGIVMLLMWAMGGMSVTGLGSASGMQQGLGLALVSGVTEEIMMRGIIFRNIERIAGTWIALVITALMFGAMHLPNPHATMLSSLAIALESGILLAGAYVATRSLWWPIGIHIGWNFTEGGIFGLAVSGGEAKGMIQASTSGAPWLTGGEFGPEASVLAVVTCVVATIGFFALAVKRKQIMAPLEWKRRVARPASIAPSF